MSSSEHTSKVLCPSGKDAPRVVLKRFDIGTSEIDSESQDIVDFDQDSYLLPKETETKNEKEEERQEQEHETSEQYVDAQEYPEVHSNRHSLTNDNNTIDHHENEIESEEEEEEEEEKVNIWKCQGRNNWCNGFCLPFRVTGTSVISDGVMDLLRVYCTELGKAEVGRDQHCVFAINARMDFDVKRRWYAKEGSVRRRERVERIKKKRAESKIEMPVWRRSLVYTSSTLGWDNGLWGEGL